MDSIEKINGVHKIYLGISPKEADLAIVSIDSEGTPGALNLYVLREYGYSNDRLPKREQLKHGFGTITEDKQKSIIFVVTVSEEETAKNLENNLYNTLREFRGWFRSKRLWIPLMGSGSGGLNLVESYLITVRAINRFLVENFVETTFIISLPNDENGRALQEKINQTSSNDPELISNAYKNFKGNFFLVGANWEGEDQFKFFYEKNIWETGYEDKYAEIINTVKAGDILIVKSTFAKDRVSILRIKAVGRVTANPLNGQRLEVDWKIKNLQIDVPHLGYHRNTIIWIENKELDEVLDEVGRDKIYNAGLLDVSIWGRSTQNVKIDNDSAFPPNDLLDISSEINVFARLLAQRDLQPPLAIALFGEWGSGKSFFINHLQLKIKQLSNSKIVKKGSDQELYYCKNIIHIPFNAWAYLDANLWIGFMACIFEKIDEYITGQTKLGKLKEGVRTKLSNELEFVKDQKASILSKKFKLEQKRKTLEGNIKAEKLKLDKTIKDLTEESWLEKIKLIWTELKVEDKYKDQLEKLGLTPEVLEKTANEEIPSKIRSFKNFITQFKSLSGTQLVGTILLSLGLIVAGIFISNAEWFNNLVNGTTKITAFLVLTLSGAITKISAAFNFFKPYVDKALKVQLDFNQKIKEAEREHQDKITQVQLEKEGASIEIETLTHEIEKIDNEIDGLEYSLNNGLEKIVLTDFIKKRITSADYTDKLGVVSVIRKDLETLSELFIGQKIDPTLSEGEKKQQEEKKEKLEKIKADFDGEPIERIILYIDDLDRCSDGKVLEVLQAVHLLMAFPLFIVVVGVDKRCVSNALFQSEQSKYFKLHAESQIENHNIQPIAPDEYLEKIFQIPFQLKESSKEAVDKMIESLLSKDVIQIESDKKDDIQSNGEQNTTEVETNSTKGDETPTVVLPIVDVGPEDLKITKDELNYIKDLSYLIGSSPRTIKRYINLYRLIKAHEGLGQDKPEKEIICTLFILAINIGQHKVYSNLFFDNVILNPTKKLKEIFIIFKEDEYASFYNSLTTKSDLMIKISEYQCVDILKHYRFVKRFSFNATKEIIKTFAI